MADLSDRGMMWYPFAMDGSLVEALALHEHPWFIGTQNISFWPLSAHPVFISFIGALIEPNTTKTIKGDIGCTKGEILKLTLLPEQMR